MKPELPRVGRPHGVAPITSVSDAVWKAISMIRFAKSRFWNDLPRTARSKEATRWNP